VFIRGEKPFKKHFPTLTHEVHMTRRTLILLLLIGILLAACAPSAPGQPTPDIQGTANALGATLAVAVFQTQTALAPAATNTAIPTATSLATSTPLTLSTPTTFVQQPVLAVSTATPTGTYYTATPLASSLGSGCKNLRLINSWTVPEGPFIAGQEFTQVWHVENNGTCEWLYMFTFEFASGDRTGEATSVRFGSKAPAGEWRQISVGMRAPNKTGTYEASSKMTDGAGAQFGAPLPVSITVTGSTNTPKPPTATNTPLPPTATGTPTQTPDVAATNAQATANCLGTQAVGGTCPSP
jgi:hypothetical protein